MFKQSRDCSERQKSTNIALLDYRNTPISEMDLSPSQLLMSRRLSSSLPMTETLLLSQVNETAKKQLQKRQQKQVQYYNRPLPPLSQGDVVRYKTNKHTAPRSYSIQTLSGNIIHRNRRHLKKYHLLYL